MSPVSIVRLRRAWDTDVTQRWVFVASVTAYAMYRSKICTRWLSSILFEKIFPKGWKLRGKVGRSTDRNRPEGISRKTKLREISQIRDRLASTITQRRLISSRFDGRMFLEETEITWKAKDDDPWTGTRTGQNFTKREISRWSWQSWCGSSRPNPETQFAPALF